MFFFSPCSLWQACWFPPGNISVAQNLWLVDKLKTAFNDQLPSGIHCHCFWNKVARLLEYTLWSQLPPIRQVLSKCLRVEPTLGCCPYPYGLWYFHSKTGSKQHNGRESGECVCVCVCVCEHMLYKTFESLIAKEKWNVFFVATRNLHSPTHSILNYFCILISSF